MTRRPATFAVLTMLVLPALGWAADSQSSKSADQASQGQVFADVHPSADGNVPVFTDVPRYGAYDVRFGWWVFWNNGSPSKTGEYQDLHSGAFFDVDGFSSDGIRTFAFTATGSDNETDKANLYYYQNGASAKVDYDRFIHRLDHDPLNNMPNPSTTLPTSTMIIKQDLGAGQDYAVRVQEIKASFKGVLSDNLKVRLDLWGMEKDGVRQVNAVAMCFTQPGGPVTAANPPLPPGHPALTSFNGGRCHVLSMPQQIDWQTAEIKPVIEARLGEWTMEYSRPMRSFTASDQITTRYYDGVGNISFNAGNPNPYQFAAVPSNYTQMDQVKVSGPINDDTHAYAYMMIGNTADLDTDQYRYFNDMDFRITNTSIENVNLTGYGTVYNDDEAAPTAANNGGAQAGINQNYETVAGAFANQLIHPIDYHKTTGGMKGVWRPWGTGFGLGGLAIVAGYEYCDLQRDYALYPVTNTIPFTTYSLFDDQHTITNSFQIGPDVRWSPHFDTYLHYKYQNADQPLIGLNSSDITVPAGVASAFHYAVLNGVTNTLLPTEDNIVEIGCTLMPSEHFILNACVGLEAAVNHSSYANYSEQNFPFNINAWYAATERFSMSAGYSLYSNFVGQTITLADQGSATAVIPTSSSIWSYGGQAHVFTLGGKYQASERVRLTGQIEYVLGHDLINNSTTAVNTNAAGTPATVTDLGAYSEVQNQTTRFNMGVDWTIRPRVVVFGRYEFYDFLDREPGYESGTAQGILGGLSAIF